PAPAIPDAQTRISGNFVPVANDGAVNAVEDTPILITLTATDENSTDVLTYSIVTPPAHGLLSGTGSKLTFTPAPNFFGNDSFTFKASDGQSDSNTATISITVAAVNDAPVSADGTLDATAGSTVTGQLNATDVDSTALTFAIVEQ